MPNSQPLAVACASGAVEQAWLNSQQSRQTLYVRQFLTKWNNHSVFDKKLSQQVHE
jgi:hypothetical protein